MSVIWFVERITEMPTHPSGPNDVMAFHGFEFSLKNGPKSVIRIEFITFPL